jgi:hypothetical protein
MSPAGSSASAYRIFMLNTLEPVISFKTNIASSPGGFPLSCLFFCACKRMQKRAHAAWLFFLFLVECYGTYWVIEEFL